MVADGSGSPVTFPCVILRSSNFYGFLCFFVRAVERNNLWKKEDKNGFPIIMIVMLNEAFQILFFAEELSFQDLCRQNYETLVKRNKLNLGQL